MIYLKQQDGNLLLCKDSSYNNIIEPNKQKSYDIKAWREENHFELAKDLVRFHSISQAKDLKDRLNKKYNRNFEVIDLYEKNS